MWRHRSPDSGADWTIQRLAMRFSDPDCQETRQPRSDGEAMRL